MNTYKLLKRKINGIKKLQGICILTLSLYTFALYGFVLLIQYVIDNVTASKTEIAFPVFLIALFLLLLLSILSFVSQYVFQQLPIKAKNMFLNTMFKDILHKPCSFFKEHDASQLYSLLINDGVSFSQISAVNTVVIVYQLITLILCIFLLFYTQWILTLILLIFILACFVITSYLSKKIGVCNKQIFSEKEEMTSQVMEGFRYYKVIQLLEKQNIFSNKFHRFLNNRLQKAETKQVLYNSFYMTIYTLLTTILPFLSVVLGLCFVAFDIMTIGQVLTFYTLTTQLQEPIRQIAEVKTNKDTILQLAQRLEIFIEESVTKGKQIDKIKSIVLDDVCFSYDKHSILDAIQTCIYPVYKHILIEGESGCGKSTFLSLLMNFQQPTQGHVLVNGVKLEEIAMDSYYKQVLYVDQKPIIFHDSVKQNITLYDDYTEEDVQEVVQTCQLMDYYKENENTIVDEKKLSGGQAQRIAIARILLRKPKLLLLDEPTSALDEITGQKFSLALKKYCDSYKIQLVIVSHKKDIMSICEEKWTLSQGKFIHESKK